MPEIKIAVLNDLGRSGKQPRKFKVQANNDDIEGYNGEIVTLDIWDEKLVDKLEIEVGKVMTLPVKFDDKWRSFKLIEWEVKDQISKKEMNEFIEENFLADFTEEDLDDFKLLETDIVKSVYREPYYNYKALYEYSPSYSNDICIRSLFYSKRYLEIFNQYERVLIEGKHRELNLGFRSNWVGEAIHNYLSYQVRKHFERKNNFARVELLGIEETISRDYDNFRLKGRYDMLFKVGDIVYICDIKTRRSDYLYPSDSLKPYAEKMLLKNKEQLLKYIDISDMDLEIRGMIFEVYLDSDEHRFLPVKFDPEMIEEVLNFYKELVVIEKSGQIPEIPEDYSIDSFPCKGCEFQVICYQFGKAMVCDYCGVEGYPYFEAETYVSYSNCLNKVNSNPAVCEPCHDEHGCGESC